MARRPASSKRVVRAPQPSDDRSAPPSPAKAGHYVRWWFIAAIGLAIAIGGGWYWQQHRLGELPAPPATGLNAAIAMHVNERYAAVQKEPNAIAAVGPLCIAYHADMLFDL